MRLLEQADRRKAGVPASSAAGFLAPTPGPALTDADLGRALRAGLPPAQGIDVRNDAVAPPALDPSFEGTFQFTHRSEEHTSELPPLMRNSYAVFHLKKNNSTTLHSM